MFQLNDIWAPVIAAIGASSLTAVTTFGVTGWQARQQRRNDRLQARKAAYGQMLSTSGVLMQTAQALRLVADFRSGIREGMEVALGYRMPVDPLELSDVLRRDYKPLMEGWTAVWLHGTPAGVRCANRVLECAGAMFESGEAAARSGWQRWMSLHHRRVPRQQDDAFGAATRDLATARKELGELARREFGYEDADLFAQ